MLLDIIELFVKNLVDKPEAVKVKEIQSYKVNNQNKILIEIKVSSQDLPRVIGKEGKTFKALRSFVKAVEFNSNKDIVVDVNL